MLYGRKPEAGKGAFLSKEERRPLKKGLPINPTQPAWEQEEEKESEMPQVQGESEALKQGRLLRKYYEGS